MHIQILPFLLSIVTIRRDPHSAKNRVDYSSLKHSIDFIFNLLSIATIHQVWSFCQLGRVPLPSNIGIVHIYIDPSEYI